MKKITYFLITVLALTLTACGSIATDTEDAEVTEAVVTEAPTSEPTPEPTPEPPKTPDFCGSWRTTAPAGDGTKFVLEVYLNADGSARYKAGPPESEFMMDAKGTWTAEGDAVTLDLYDTMEGFAFKGTYKWSMNGNLSLTHISGDAFLYGTEGTTITFGRK